MSCSRLIVLFSFFVAMNLPAQAQTGPTIPLENIPQAAGAHLRIVTADGKVIEQAFAQGQAPSISLRLSDGSLLPDGVHRWELVYSPRVSPALREAARIARDKGDEQLPAGWPAALPARSGVVSVLGGAFVDMSVGEGDQDAEPKTAQSAKDQVIADARIRFV